MPILFRNGKGQRDEHIKTIDRSLKAVFRKSGVSDAAAHRFRHTLATQILISSGATEDAANILGDSREIIRKHYRRYSKAYQERTVAIFQ